ncbi:CoA-binding protein [Plebeiibacterium marinum]|uniref:CoA-binding protein n=1 Tax=Plebeiibacterium marinum TaxID=2992111 RepID=A0AAE3MAA4_9BACT|nr:CoA-binding protein [Plebeiobacterium marinum]MCW3804213.1 CoA-binding protein [Plebeiobacterium marinum]
MNNKKTLVIGASENPERYSNKAVKKLTEYNHPVVAVGNRMGNIDMIPITTEVLDTADIDTVTLYIGAKHQAKYFDIIASLKPQRIIFNPGTENTEMEEFAKDNNIEVLHACTLVLLSTGQY